MLQECRRSRRSGRPRWGVGNSHSPSHPFALIDLPCMFDDWLCCLCNRGTISSAIRWLPRHSFLCHCLFDSFFLCRWIREASCPTPCRMEQCGWQGVRTTRAQATVECTIPPATADRSEGLNYTIVIHTTPHTMIVYIWIVQHMSQQWIKECMTCAEGGGARPPRPRHGDTGPGLLGWKARSVWGVR